MAKCDVCGKTSLFPERFGEVNICKICFMKVNGPFWKHQYDRHEDAEKHRCRALEAVHKNNFPQPAVSAINDYFIAQMNSMLVCDCCGMPVQHRQPLGEANICKNCYGKIDTSSWRATEYEDNEEVEKNREKTLKIATKNGFPAVVIEGINKHFDGKMQKGLLYVVDGGEGQKLKVFVDHCVLITNDDEFNVDDISAKYSKVQRRGQPKEGLISNGVAKNLARSVLSGGIVKAGIGLVTSAAINAAADKYVPEKSNFKVAVGNFKIDYHTYTYAEHQKVGDCEIGFIRFVNGKTGGKQNDDVLFFFGEDTAKLDKAYKAICEGIDEALQPPIQETPVQQTNSHTAAPISISVADEILKFKQLLDMGVITQEEFETKKKELLKL